MTPTTITQQLETAGMVPVVTLTRQDQALPLAGALSRAGLPVAEITLRTLHGLEGIRQISRECPDMLVGAGTVLNRSQAEEALCAGAGFIVSPGLVPEVVTFCLEQQVPVFPGICTPTEVCQALSLGVTHLKFFPAKTFGGLSTLKAILSVFSEVRLMPTGGITRDNAVDYLSNPGVLCCGGSYIAPKKLLEARDFDAITCIAADTAALVKKIRAQK